MRHSCNAVSRSGGAGGAAVGGLAATAVLALGALAAPAHAHEEREVGDLSLEVGWADEPAFTGATNRVQVVVTDKDSEEPVTDLGDNLQVEVTFGDGGDGLQLALEPQFTEDAGREGEYGAVIEPTRPGIYTFRVFGPVGDGEIDESFTASPDTFEEVREPTDIQFPASDLTLSQLNERLDRELARLGAGSSDAPDAAAGEVENAGDGGGDGAGTVLGIVGIVVGAAGLAVAGLALRRSRAFA